jgi:hypothetical protein
VRVLRFPLHEFVDKKKEQKAKVIIGVATVLLVGPSIWFFVNTTRKSIFETNATKFIAAEVQHINSFIIEKNLRFLTDSVPRIEVRLGGEPVSDSLIAVWETKMPAYNLQRCQLIINQDEHNERLGNKLEALERSSYENDRLTKSTLNAMIIENRIKLEVIDSLVLALENQNVVDSVNIDYPQLIAEMNTMFTGIKKVAYGQVTETNENGLDTIPCLFIDWHKISTSYKNTQIKKLNKWLEVRCVKAPVVREYN